MAEERIVKQDMQTIWIQPDGPNTALYRLGCYQVDSAEKPHGDFDQIICQDPVQPGKYKRIALTRGVPGLPSATFNGFAGDVADYFEQVARRDCSFSAYITTSECAPKNVFSNYRRGLVMEHAYITGETHSPIATRDSQDPMTLEWPVTMVDLQSAFKLSISERTSGTAADVRDVAQLPYEQCQGICGPNLDPCDVLYFACDAVGAATADVRYSVNGGATIAATSADPFAVSEDIASIVIIVKDETYVRVIVACGTTDAAAPAKIAYADVDVVNTPATTAWTNVAVGSTNGEFFNHSGSLFALDQYHLWCCTEQGEVFFSDDAGASWTAQGAAAGDELNYVYFANDRDGITVGGSTGASHVIMTTTNGGTNWDTITMTGPGATVMAWCGVMHDRQRLFVGFEGGQLYFSIDGGANWTARALPLGPAVSVVDLMDIAWVDDHFGFLAIEGVGSGDTRYAMILRTIDGGFDWEVAYVQALDTETEALKAVIACHHNHAIAVGGLDDVGPGAGIVLDLHE